jgi:hypothetical protein
MAIGDSDADEKLLVPLSEYLVRKLDAARGDESYSEYVDRVLMRAAEQTETELAMTGTVVEESRQATATITGPGQATNGEEFEQLWTGQMQTVFVWLWVGVIAIYGVGDILSTYFVVRAGIGFEANPLIAGLLEIHPALMLLWKGIALVVMYAIAESVLRNADKSSIPWGSLAIPGVLVVWGSFITGMNIMNIPGDAQSTAAASILSSIVTIVVGYVLLDQVYQDFVKGQDEYNGLLTTSRQWVFDRPWIWWLRADPRASRAVRDLMYPGVLVGVAAIVGVLMAILPPGGEFRSFLFRPTRYADLLLVSAGLVTVGMAIVLLSREVDSPRAGSIGQAVTWGLRIGTGVAAVMSMLFLLSLTSTGGTSLLGSTEDILGLVGSWLTARIGPLAIPGTLYIEHSPIGLTVGEAAAVMAVAGLLSSLPMLRLLYRHERARSDPLAG